MSDIFDKERLQNTLPTSLHQRYTADGCLEVDLRVVLECIVQPGVVAPRRRNYQSLEVRVHCGRGETEGESLSEVLGGLLSEEHEAIQPRVYHRIRFTVHQLDAVNSPFCINSTMATARDERVPGGD